MAIKTNKGIAGTIMGAVLIFTGCFWIARPTAESIPHPDGESGIYFLERVSKETSRVYGVISLLLGAGIIGVARWPRWGARRTAIDDYIWGLSLELSRRLGTKNYYSVEEVSQIANKSGCKMAYIAYAHAIFCNRGDFDAYYRPKRVAFTFDGLRDEVARRYFRGASGFDAATVVRRATPLKERECDLVMGD